MIMKQLLVLVFVLMAIVVLPTGCRQENVEPETSLYLPLEVDGQKYEVLDIEAGGNENCESLYVGIHYFIKDSDISYPMKFVISTKGHLQSAQVHRWPHGVQRKVFLTPRFHPTATFNISDFSFDVVTGMVKFRYAGTVFWRYDNEQSLTVSGNVEVELALDIPCGLGVRGLEYESDEIGLFSLGLAHSRYSTGRQTHQFFTPDGYRIDLWTIGDLWNYPLGEEMEFVPNDYTKDWVEFYQMIGPLIANEHISVGDVQWKEYETSGTIVLENKYIENGDRMISGKMYLTIRDEGKQLYYLDGVSFRTGSHEN
jgi:hypothetical protein